MKRLPAAQVRVQALWQLCNDTATLHLLGGDLKITWDKKENTVYMEGPAETVFTGEWQLKEEN